MTTYAWALAADRKRMARVKAVTGNLWFMLTP
jgi:hypothetical protein